MKRFLALAALVLGMVSCQTEPEGLDVIVGGEQEAVINVSLAEATRTSADSGIVNVDNNVYDLRYILEVYDTASTTCVYRDVQTVATGVKTVSFPVRLIPERDYNFVVWADFVTNDSVNDRYYTTTNGLDEVSIIPSMWVQMDEARDAYTGNEIVTGYNSGKSINITLTRPFGKLRVITTDIDALNKLIGQPMPKSITVTYTNQVYTAFDALIQKPIQDTESSKSYAYDLANVYKEDWTTENRTLFTDYIFGTESGSIQFTMDVVMTNDNVVSNNFNTEIPVKRNYLTTITGDILTDGNNIKVDVSDGFENAGGTDPDYEHSTISSDAEFLAALNADGKFIVISNLHIKDKVITPGLLSTRAGEATGNVSTINLNGYTITVENKTNEALATVNAGNTLFLESGLGGGKIVLAEGSKASFIENKGNVILTSGEVKNESTEAPVVAGTIVVNEDAVLNDDEVADENKITVSEENDGWLANVLENGGTYVFTADMRRADQIKITATAPVVLDGNGYTFTYTGSDRAIEIPAESTNANVTIKNLNIAFGASYCQRGINFNVTGGTLTIDNVKVSENGGYATYAINLPGSSDEANVTINNSYLRGNIALNVWGANMVINATNTEFVSADKSKDENYAAISLNNDGAGNCADGTVVTIEGGKIIALDENGEEADAISNLTNTGTVAVSGSTEVIGTISNPVAEVIYEGYNEFYSCNTLQEAIDQVCKDNSGSIRLIKDITIEEPITIPAGEAIVIDLNGKTITGPSAARDAEGNKIHVIVNNGSLTVNGEGLVKSVATNGGSAILNNGVLTLDNVTIEGAPSDTDTGTASYAVNTEGEGSRLVVNNSSISGRGAIGATNGTKVELNGGTYHTPAVAWGHAIYAKDEGTEVVVNDGTFSEGYAYAANNWGMYQIYSGEKAKVIVNGGDFSQPWDCANGYDLCTATEGTIEIYGGTFADDPSKQNGKNFVAEGYKVKANDGNYTVVPESAVAMIGKVCYTSLNEAVAAIQDGETITLVANEVFTENNYYDNGGWKDGLGYAGDKSFTIDLGGNTVSQNGALNDYLLWFKNVGSKANTITIKNGTLDAGTTAYCALCTASSHENELTVNLENITLTNKKSNGSTIKVRGGSTLNVNADTKIIGEDSYLGIECVASTVNIYDGAEIYMNGTSSDNGCLAGACGGGIINVYGGYGKGVKGGFIAMTSGGTINVSGGEWIANTDGSIGNNSNLYVLTAQSNRYESGFVGGAYINVTGGTFRGGMDAWVLNNLEGEEAKLSISGGNFNANPANYVVAGYEAVEDNGLWTVVAK